jgi:hypothetical protein
MELRVMRGKGKMLVDNFKQISQYCCGDVVDN